MSAGRRALCPVESHIVAPEEALIRLAQPGISSRVVADHRVSNGNTCASRERSGPQNAHSSHIRACRESNALAQIRQPKRIGVTVGYPDAVVIEAEHDRRIDPYRMVKREAACREKSIPRHHRIPATADGVET